MEKTAEMVSGWLTCVVACGKWCWITSIRRAVMKNCMSSGRIPARCVAVAIILTFPATPAAPCDWDFRDLRIPIPGMDFASALGYHGAEKRAAIYQVSFLRCYTVRVSKPENADDT